MTAAQTYRTFNAALAIGSLLLGLVAWSFTVTADGEGLIGIGGWRVPELCATKRLTGRPCASCNLARSVVLAVQGDVARSRASHPGGVLVAGWLALHVLLRALGAFRPPAPKFWRLDLAVTAFSLLVLLLAVLAQTPN